MIAELISMHIKFIKNSLKLKTSQKTHRNEQNQRFKNLRCELFPIHPSKPVKLVTNFECLVKVAYRRLVANKYK